MTKPSLGLIGYGAFGRLTARHLSAWFDILAHDPAAAEGDGVATLVSLAEAAACPTVVLAVPVEALAATLDAIRPHLAANVL